MFPRAGKREDFLLCRVLKQMLCTCHQQLKVKNLLLRKAEILQNAKIAHQPRCLYRFHQLLPDIESYINIKQKSFQRVTHEISFFLCVMRRPRTQESLATGLASCSKLEEGCVLNRLSKATNLCLEAVKERIAIAEFLPNYPDRSSDLSQSMKITTTLNVSCQDARGECFHRNQHSLIEL